MSDPPPSSSAKSTLTDSPWFWVMVFCAAGVLFLLAIWPQYAARQRRLEMQYLAREEIVRRQAAGEAARLPGEEGDAPPPAAGELIIPIWPLLVPLTVLAAVSATLLWRQARRRARSGRSPPREAQ